MSIWNATFAELSVRMRRKSFIAAGGQYVSGPPPKINEKNVSAEGILVAALFTI